MSAQLKNSDDLLKEWSEVLLAHHEEQVRKVRAWVIDQITKPNPIMQYLKAKR